MKMIKGLLTLLLVCMTACAVAPDEPLPGVTPSQFTETIPPLQPTKTVLPTATKTISPTITPTKKPPSPTIEPLIPTDLQPITIDNLPNLEVIGEIPFKKILPDHNIYSLIISSDGTKLATLSESWKTRNIALLVWDLITNSLLLQIEDPPYTIEWTSFSQDNQHLLVIHDEFLDRYNLEQALLERTMVLPEHDRGSVAISPDEKYVVTGKYDGASDQSTIEFFHSGTDEFISSEQMAYMILSFHFSPDSNMVSGISSSIGARMTKIWQLESGSLLQDFINYDGGPVFSSDNTLAVFLKGNNVSVFSTDSWVLQSSAKLGISSNAMMPKFLLGNNQIIALSDTYNAAFFNIINGKEIFILPVQVSRINYSPAMNVLVTAWNLENIKLWGILP